MVQVLVLPKNTTPFLFPLAMPRVQFLAGFSTSLGDFEPKVNPPRYFPLILVSVPVVKTNNSCSGHHPVIYFKIFYCFRSPAHKFQYTCRYIKKWAGIAQSVQRLAVGWTVRGSNPGGARFSAPVQTGPGAYPASCTMGTGSFPGVKRPVRGADHQPPSKCQGQ